MQVTNMLLDSVEVLLLSMFPQSSSENFFQNLLSPKGHFYLVVLKQNNISRIRQHMDEVYHLKGEVSKHFTSLCHLIPS